MPKSILLIQRVKDEAKRPAVAARLRGDLGGEGVSRADLVIEAIIENPEAKRALYADIEPRLQPHALLTTNTSSIPLDELRGHIARPAQFAGLHYFNPVALMPLVEIVRHEAMAEETQRRLENMAGRIAPMLLAAEVKPEVPAPRPRRRDGVRQVRVNSILRDGEAGMEGLSRYLARAAKDRQGPAVDLASRAPVALERPPFEYALRAAAKASEPVRPLRMRKTSEKREYN